MVLGGCQVTPAPVCTPQHGASQCLDKQNLPHRGWHVLLRHLKSRKLPLQHRQALGIFCWIIFFFPSYPSRLFLCILRFLLFPGWPMSACVVVRPTHRSALWPGSWTHSLFLSCTWFLNGHQSWRHVFQSKWRLDWGEGRRSIAFLTKAGLKWTKISPLCAPTGPASVSHTEEASFHLKPVSVLFRCSDCVCVCCGEAGGACLSRNTFSQG